MLRKMGVLFFFLLSGCGMTSGNIKEQGQVNLYERERLPSVFPAEKLPRAASLTKAFFKQNALGATDAEFETRWAHSLKSPLMFLRSHVRAYYALTSATVGSEFPRGYCYGDAHPGNFGFIENTNSEAFFAYNDLDDSGFCPVILDALRYFTALRLFQDEGTVQKELAFYGEVLNNQAAGRPLSAQYYPNFAKVRKKVLDKDSSGKLLLRDPTKTKDVPAELASTIKKTVKETFAESGLGNVKVWDMVEAFGHGGGSLGLERYWILTRDSSGIEDILELKREAEPATSFGKWGEFPKGARLQSLMQYFWHDRAKTYKSLPLNGQDFLLRSRIKVSTDASDPSEKIERTDLIAAQLTLLASLHKKTYGELAAADVANITQWLKEGSLKLAEIYNIIVQQAK